MIQEVQIKPNTEDSNRIEILVDGVNIANRIYGYTLTQEPCSFPILEVKSNNLTFEFNGDAFVIDKTAHEEIKRLRENMKVLDEALREYQRKYGE